MIADPPKPPRRLVEEAKGRVRFALNLGESLHNRVRLETGSTRKPFRSGDGVIREKEGKYDKDANR